MNTIDIEQLTKYLLLKDIENKDIKKIHKSISLTTYKEEDIIIKENDTGESILFLIWSINHNIINTDLIFFVRF
mgnify:CR=1 FL=1